MVLCCGCPANSGGSYTNSVGGYDSMLSEGMSFADMDYESVKEIDQSQDNQKWVVTVDIDCETMDYDNMYSWIRNTVNSSGGYLEEEREWGDERRTANFSIRIPIAESEGFLENLSQLCNITDRTQRKENVTIQYADTENYIKALRIEQGRLMELLEMAMSVQDIISIEDRLTTVRTQIEGAEYRLRSLANKIDYATITLRLHEVVVYTRTPTTYFGQAIQGFGENFSDTIEFVLNFILWVFTHIPALCVAGGVIFILRKFVHFPKHKKKKKEVVSTDETSSS